MIIYKLVTVSHQCGLVRVYYFDQPPAVEKQPGALQPPEVLSGKKNNTYICIYIYIYIYNDTFFHSFPISLQTDPRLRWEMEVHKSP